MEAQLIKYALELPDGLNIDGCNNMWETTVLRFRHIPRATTHSSLLQSQYLPMAELSTKDSALISYSGLQ